MTVKCDCGLYQGCDVCGKFQFRPDGVLNSNKTIGQIIEFGNADWYFRINPDGTVDINEKLTMAEAAQEFWKMVETMRPTPQHAFPLRDPSKPAEQQGLYEKFRVTRTDGSSAPGGKHHDCRYFVLDLNHDKYAPAAMRAYAKACDATHSLLADAITMMYGSDEPVTTVKPSHTTSNETQWRYEVPAHKGGKMQLLTIGGVMVTGAWTGELGELYLAWAPLIKRDRAKEAIVIAEAAARRADRGVA